MAVFAALDQSRWQPLLGAPSACRLFLVCTYFYSGLQKLGYGFVIVLAGMLEPMFTKFHLNPAWLSPRTLLPLAILLGLVECASGALLLLPRTPPLSVSS